MKKARKEAEEAARTRVEADITRTKAEADAKVEELTALLEQMKERVKAHDAKVDAEVRWPPLAPLHPARVSLAACLPLTELLGHRVRLPACVCMRVSYVLCACMCVGVPVWMLRVRMCVCVCCEFVCACCAVCVLRRRCQRCRRVSLQP